MWAGILLSGNGVFHAIGVSSTASQAGENDKTNVSTQQSFRVFQHTQPSEEISEEELHHQIHP
jgi:hypothetical protein